MYNLDRTIKRLKVAIRNKYDIKLLITTKEWYSEKRGVLMPYYIISQHHFDPVTNKSSQEELFRCGNKIKVVLFLRDYWYQLNGWEIPKDEYWDKQKGQYDIRYDGTGKGQVARRKKNPTHTG